MYEVHFRRKMSDQKDYTLIGKGFQSLEEAKKHRFVSGDLVVYADTHKVVQDTSWLWDLEKKKKNCYPMMAIARGY